MDEEQFFKDETNAHRDKVKDNIEQILDELDKRAINHDKSKFSEEEALLFIEYTPKLKTSTYGSEEYKGFLEDLKPALDHHYSANRHHPEHFENGIQDMTLIDLIEMLADWYAATKRHDNGNLLKSIEINQERFKYSDEFKTLLINTVKSLGWV